MKYEWSDCVTPQHPRIEIAVTDLVREMTGAEFGTLNVPDLVKIVEDEFLPELTTLREKLAAAEKRAEAAEAVASAVTNALTIGDKDLATLGLWSAIDKNGDGKQKYVARVTHPYHGRADSDACESIAEALQSASKAMATRQIRKQEGTDDATD